MSFPCNDAWYVYNVCNFQFERVTCSLTMIPRALSIIVIYNYAVSIFSEQCIAIDEITYREILLKDCETLYIILTIKVKFNMIKLLHYYKNAENLSRLYKNFIF